MAFPTERFIALFHRRWAIPILVELQRDDGAKFVTLASRLGIGRATLRATLDDLITLGLVRRNPRYGHPMRPEYLLTTAGQRVAPSSDRLLTTVRRLGLEPLALRKWTMPLTYALGRAELRFSELRDALGEITPRALTLSLKDMHGNALVERDVYDDYPPVARYHLSRRARPIHAALLPLARSV